MQFCDNICAMVTFRDGLLGLVPPRSVQGRELVSPPALSLPLQSASAATVNIVINIVINIAVDSVINMCVHSVNIVPLTAVVAVCQETICSGHLLNLKMVTIVDNGAAIQSERNAFHGQFAMCKSRRNAQTRNIKGIHNRDVDSWIDVRFSCQLHQYFTRLVSHLSTSGKVYC